MAPAAHQNGGFAQPVGHGGRVRTFESWRGARDPDAALVVALVAVACGVPAPLLFHASRCQADVAEARQLAMYLMHVILRRPYHEIGRAFGRDRTTVAHACARIEDRRDGRTFDSFVEELGKRLEVCAEVREKCHAGC